MGDEKTLLVRSLEEIEKEVHLLKRWEEFLQRMSRLDKYLQAPDESSDYAKYEKAFAALLAVKARLYHVTERRSQFRNFLCFMGLTDTIPELEEQIARYAWIVEQLCRKLKLSGIISLQQEYQRLDDQLELLLAQGFAPSAVSKKILTLEITRTEINNQLADVEALLYTQTKKERDSFAYSKPAQLQSFAPLQNSALNPVFSG